MKNDVIKEKGVQDRTLKVTHDEMDCVSFDRLVMKFLPHWEGPSGPLLLASGSHKYMAQVLVSNLC